MEEAAVVEVDVDKVTDQDSETINQLGKYLNGVRDNLLSAAPLFAKLSRPGLREAKRKFKSYIGAEHINRLVEFARGNFPEYLALRCKSMRFGYYLRLKKKSREILWNPNSQISLATVNGEVSKLASECNIFELHQAFDPRFDGIVPLSEQRKNFKIEPLKQEKDDPTIQPVEEFRIAVVPGTEWLIMTVDGKRFKIRGRQFRREARFFR